MAKKPSALARAMLATALALCPLGAARADEIRTSDGQILSAGITIKGVENGELRYAGVGGVVKGFELAKVRGIRKDGYPALDAVETDLRRADAGDIRRDYKRGAYEKLQAFTQTRITEPWLQVWALHKTMRLAEELRELKPAAAAYLALLKTRPDPWFLAEPPEAALDSLTAEQAAEAVRLIDGLLPGAGASRPALQRVRDRLSGGVVDPGPGPTIVSPGPATQPASVPMALDTLVLPAAIPLNDEVSLLLRDRKFAEARQRAGQLADNADEEKKHRRLDVRLYQLGLAQLHEGLASREENLLKEAGISFMRIVVFHKTSRLLGPALVELGLVHYKIGRPDLAGALYTRANRQVFQATDPQMRARLERLSQILRESKSGT